MLATIALACLAQLPVAPPATVGHVRVANYAPMPRRDVVTVTLPFARGTYRGEPLAVDGQGLQVAQIGAAWPDGSWRHARAMVPVLLGSSETVQLPIEQTSSATAAFRWTPAIVAGAGKLRIVLDVDGSAMTFGGWVPVESGHLVAAFRSRGRIAGSPFWGECVLEVGSGIDHVRWWLHYGTSDSTRPEVTWEAGPVTMRVTGPRVVVRHAAAKELLRIETGDATAITLDRGGRWCEGQSQVVSGVLLFPGSDLNTLAAEKLIPVVAMSTDWPSSGAFGAWGWVPPPPEDISDPGRRAWLAQQDYLRWGVGDPWEWPLHGCVPTPNTTGDQSDFGAVVMIMAANGYPERSHSTQRSVYGEACRPTHLRDEDGAPFLFSARPDVNLWQGRPYRAAGSATLGKARDLNTSDPRRSARAGMVWWGHDRQHWSINYLATYALLTSDRWALSECQHKTELWLGEMRVNSGSPVLDGMGAGRAVGRTLHAGTLLWLVTGRQDLADRIRARVDITDQQWTGRSTAPVQPPETRGPYPGNLDGLTGFSMPWQSGFFVMGLDAVDRTFGNRTARDVADLALASVLTFGVWRKDQTWTGADSNNVWPWNPTGPWTTGKAVQWFAGGSSPRQAGAQWHRYDPYGTWLQPALKIALRQGIENATARSYLDQINSTPTGDPWRRAQWQGVR